MRWLALRIPPAQAWFEIFRKTAQMAPLAFLTEMRLEIARRKLAGTRRPLAGIAAEVGYQSESAFSRAFQLRYGLRPGEARGERRS